MIDPIKEAADWLAQDDATHWGEHEWRLFNVVEAVEELHARLEAVEKERDDARKLQAKDFELLDSPWKQRAERAEAALATARREALEEAAEIAESHKPSSSFISDRYWRGVDEAAHSIA
ncbi:hypothetical protein, partial [Yoonia sp.]|uniref:hypothetical protein n=1 Tax=Yoonia sp. TaxID=2212373 RepID=UPI002E03B5C0|nr:hypothetical protein [Yoonia sp.]